MFTKQKSLFLLLLLLSGCSSPHDPATPTVTAQPVPASSQTAPAPKTNPAPVAPLPASIKAHITSSYTESQRRNIYYELITADYRAAKESEAKYPGMDQADPNTEAGKALLQSQANLQETLTTKYQAAIAAHYHLTTIQADDILQEGSQRRWPTPEK